MKPIQFTKMCVTQADLERIVSRRNIVELNARELRKDEENVLMRLTRGAAVEPGVHQAWLEEEMRGRVRKQRLEVR